MQARRPAAKKVPAPLDKYRGKRDFQATPEPDAGPGAAAGNSFVVHEHHARSYHFDLKLEMDGLLVSWALPKGIPADPAEKRLAVHVEDHPLEYGKFEGVIPKGNYGAGTVKIWDKGEWEPLGEDWRKSLGHGKLKIMLRGARLHGLFVLTRMGEEPNWLMRKLNDSFPPDPDGAGRREQARFVSPQLARVVPAVPTGNEWIHEIKFDGYRLIVVKQLGEVRIFTRNQLDWTDRFRALADRLGEIHEGDFVMDGEAVVFDAKGRSRFGELQAALQSGDGDRISFVVFDLLHLDGLNLRELSLADRIRRLAELVGEGSGPVIRSKVWSGDLGRDLFKQACENKLEGIISKRSKGRYLEGERRGWAKLKCRARQEFIVCGYTAPKGGLGGFGALVLASFENGRLVPRGKVGTGFSDVDRMKMLELFRPLHVTRAPFQSNEKQVKWLEPSLVAEVEFAELTAEGSIRHGSFIALREDKPPSEVHLEGVQVASAAEDVTVAGIAISNPERLVYPGESVSKIEVARYYARVGELMLPFVANRPLALLRAPSGITGELFFQKSFSGHLPQAVYQKTLEDGTTVIYVKDTKGIVSLAQFGVIEFHPWGAPRSQPDKPDFLIWDLDPDESVAWNEVLGAAFLLRDFLAESNLSTVVKTSGGKGIHIVLHLKKNYHWELMKEFSKGVARAVASYNPRRFTITSNKSRRTGKIYIDWVRNGRGATCIAPWSLRARPGATVSMPVNWGDLHGIKSDQFTIHHSPVVPSEWMEINPQSITRTVLRRVGLDSH